MYGRKYELGKPYNEIRRIHLNTYIYMDTSTPVPNIYARGSGSMSCGLGLNYRARLRAHARYTDS